MSYQVFVKRAESRSTVMEGPLGFETAEARREYARDNPTVYWYHYAEEDDWHAWHRGGAWAATALPGPADRENTPPEITEGDRWLSRISTTRQGRAENGDQQALRASVPARLLRAEPGPEEQRPGRVSLLGRLDEGDDEDERPTPGAAQPGVHHRVPGRQAQPL